ncbi:CaiB/BaiF CoA transferase family protein [Algihabitans albus]|uniref:CaiB/BaiF CoA transferase family protein n=1 Tax=Algihabitans albus TaxID=2164067 RepID=UPI000E5C6EE4|nr:CoA transferase [Algihabitans albus]
MTFDLLAGLRVVDLSQWLPGPFAGQILGDLGAEVVKVEPPAGDPMRQLGPRDPDGLSAWYKQINAGKTILRLDLKADAGREVFAELLRGADVLLESYRPGTLEKLGFDGKRRVELNRRLIHCALSGYGQTGPLRLTGGHDINYMALGGGLASSGRVGESVAAYPPTADHASALQAVIAILAAVVRQGRTGQGANLDISLMEAVLAWQALPFTSALRGGSQAQVRGQGLLNGGAAFYRLYRTADDRFVSLGAIEPKFWAAFCRAVGREDWISRQAEPLPQDALTAEVAALLAGRLQDHWNDLLSDVDCCFMPVLEPEEVLLHPQIQARGLARAGEGPSVQIAFGGLIDGRAQSPRAAVREADAAEVLATWGEG